MTEKKNFLTLLQTLDTINQPDGEQGLFLALHRGEIVAEGWYAGTLFHTTSPYWLDKEWVAHSPHYQQVPADFWNEEGIDWEKNSAKNPKGEYINLRIQEDHVRRYFQKLPPPSTYTTPYLELMKEAIIALRITEENQPLVKNIRAWFAEKDPALSENMIASLTTFIRLPATQKGGLRPTGKRKG